MDLEFLIDRLEHYILEDCPKVLGARTVNDDEIRSQLSQIRAAIPAQIPEARRIVETREQLLEAAQAEAARLLAAAEAESRRQAEEHAITQEARRQAQAIVSKAKRDGDKMQTDADEYVFDALSQLQGELARLLRVVENGLLRLESQREQMISGGSGEAAHPQDAAPRPQSPSRV